jgi:AraC-like DNA-binding protein
VHLQSFGVTVPPRRIVYDTNSTIATWAIYAPRVLHIRRAVDLGGGHIRCEQPPGYTKSRTVMAYRYRRRAIHRPPARGSLLDCSLQSSRSSVLRDEVAARTTPHEVHSLAGHLDGQVGALCLPASRLVFVRYGGDVVVEAPATGDRLVATVPLGPMHAREGRRPTGQTHTSGFLLSQRDSTVMRPDPWRGALVIASDPARLAEHTALVLDDGSVEAPEEIAGLADSPLLERACLNIWSIATTLPDETPEPLVESLMNALEEQLLTALILSAQRAHGVGTGDVRVDDLIGWLVENYSSPVTSADMARVVGVSIRRMQEAVRVATGHTPTELLREIRLDAAHRTLRRSDAHVTTVASVAHACGIAHLGRFAVQYKERYGCSPSHTLSGAS